MIFVKIIQLSSLDIKSTLNNEACAWFVVEREFKAIHSGWNGTVFRKHWMSEV